MDTVAERLSNALGDPAYGLLFRVNKLAAVMFKSAQCCGMEWFAVNRGRPERTRRRNSGPGETTPAESRAGVILPYPTLTFLLVLGGWVGAIVPRPRCVHPLYAEHGSQKRNHEGSRLGVTYTKRPVYLQM